MEQLLNILTNPLTGLIITIISPFVMYFRKGILDFLKRYLKRWYSNFLLSVAKKEKYKEIATISYLTLIIICIYIFSSFDKFENDFRKIESEFDAYKLLNDSLYLRIENNKIKTYDYHSEITDIQNGLTLNKEPKDSLNLYAKALTEKREIDRLSNLVILTKGLIEIGTVAIWVFIIYVTYLFIMMAERIRMISDFEWNLRRKGKEMTIDDVINLETRWANLKTLEDYKEIMSRLK